jgi:hypothetical protein
MALLVYEFEIYGAEKNWEMTKINIYPAPQLNFCGAWRAQPRPPDVFEQPIMPQVQFMK